MDWRTCRVIPLDGQPLLAPRKSRPSLTWNYASRAGCGVGYVHFFGRSSGTRGHRVVVGCGLLLYPAPDL